MRRTVYPQHDEADIPSSTDEPIGQTPQRERETTEQERQRQERAERVRRAREQQRRAQEAFRAREQRAQRERAALERKEQREREEQRAAQSTRQKQREEMERKRQARLAHYQEDAGQTATCFVCSQTDSTLQPIPCSRKHDGQSCCSSCIIKIQNIGTSTPRNTIRITKPCPLCRNPLNISDSLLDPTFFPYVLDENSERILWQRRRTESLLQQQAAFLRHLEGRRLAEMPPHLSRYAYNPNY